MDTPLYYCDPEKNVSCNKQGCAFNPKATFPVCHSTVNKEYAKLDNLGQPLTVPPFEIKEI